MIILRLPTIKIKLAHIIIPIATYTAKYTLWKIIINKYSNKKNEAKIMGIILVIFLCIAKDKENDPIYKTTVNIKKPVI